MFDLGLVTATFTNGHTGTSITRSVVKSLVDGLEPGVSGVGETTLLRALVTGSALQGPTSGSSIRSLQPDTRGNDRGPQSGQLDERVVSVARHLYYSRPQESAGGLSPWRVGDAVSRWADGISATLAETTRVLSVKLPGR